MKTIEERAREVDTIATRRKLGAEADTCHKPLAYVLLDEIDSLRAAAPDLLEALEALTPILEAAESNASGRPEWPWVSKRINAARAAIDKARGAA